MKGFGKQELIRGSLILFILINLFNFLNYLFHFVMARMLGPVDYGVLAVVISVAYIFSVPTEAIQTVISRLISKFNPKKEFGKMNFIFSKAIGKFLKVSIICFILMVPIAIFLHYFLPDITFFHMIFTGVLLFVVFNVPVARGVLQGRKKFKGLGWSMIAESVSKLVVAILLVFIGWKVYGAITGVVFGIFFSFFFSLFFIKEVTHQKKKKIETKFIYFYSKPIIIAIFAVMIMFSLDIIFAKRFFPSDLAGKYAIASMMGKMIFLGVMPIAKALFPIASEEADKGQKKSRSFRQALVLVLGLCAIAVAAFFFLPGLIIRILFGSQYLDIKNVLGWVGLAFAFLSIANLILLYELSLNKIRKAWFLALFPVIQIVLFFLFHETMLQFVSAFIFSNVLILIYSLFVLFKR